MLRLCFLFLIFLSLVGQAHADEKSQKYEMCFDHLRSELNALLKEDPEFITLQTTITSMKLAREVLKRKGLSSKTLESYLENIVGPKTRSYMEENQKKLISLYEKYGEKENLQNNPEILKDLGREGFASDNEVRLVMTTLSSFQKSSFPFKKEDFAIAWYLSEVAEKGGYRSNILSSHVNNILKDVDKEPSKLEEKIGRTLSFAQGKLASKLAKLRVSIFKKFEDDCLDLFNSKNKNSSNESIFEACGFKEQEIISSAFTEAMLKITSSFIPTEIGFKRDIKNLSLSDKLKIQDEINEKKTDQERIIAFQKSDLNTKKDTCENYALIDKKNFKTSIYSNDGNLITSIDTIIGAGRDDSKVFNPDSALRRFSNGTYSKTTGAGIYQVLEIPEAKRKERLYQEEFNDKVIVLAREINGEVIEEPFLAIHGVPNSEWMGSDGEIKHLGNKSERMLSFEKNWDKKLSSGCVNLEAYTFNVVNELMKNHCPIYVMPQDKNNFMYVKNFKASFGTDLEERFLGIEKIKADESNVNLYHFSLPSKEIHFREVIYKGNPLLTQKLLTESEEMIKRYKYLESDDLQLSISLALPLNSLEAFEKINNLLNEKKFDKEFLLLNSDQKRAILLDELNIKDNIILEKSKEVKFK